MTLASANFEFRLLGKFEALRDGVPLGAVDAGHVQRLLGYLLLFARQPHRREKLADVLWPGATARKRLRQALWMLQGALDAESLCLLAVDQDWIAISPAARVRTDVERLDEAFDAVRGTPGESLDSAQVRQVAEAAAAYRGELLEGWYDDWCVYERERVKSVYLALLDKLLAHAEAHGEWEAGLVYGNLILRYDHAHERAHWRMMRLHYLAGDRTGALRQYKTCATALETELGIQPSHLTTRLYEEICADRSIDDAPDTRAPRRGASLGRVLAHMRQVRRTLAYTEHLVSEDIAEIETSLSAQPPRHG